MCSTLTFALVKLEAGETLTSEEALDIAYALEGGRPGAVLVVSKQKGHGMVEVVRRTAQEICAAWKEAQWKITEELIRLCKIFTGLLQYCSIRPVM